MSTLCHTNVNPISKNEKIGVIPMSTLCHTNVNPRDFKKTQKNLKKHEKRAKYGKNEWSGNYPVLETFFILKIFFKILSETGFAATTPTYKKVIKK